MINEVQRMQHLAGINEMKVRNPIPEFESNEDLLGFLIKNPTSKIRLISSIKDTGILPNIWDDAFENWKNITPQAFDDQYSDIEIVDELENILYLSIFDDLGQSRSIEFGPNKIYFDVY